MLIVSHYCPQVASVVNHCGFHSSCLSQTNVSLDTVCKNCGEECANCGLEGETPMCLEEIAHSSSPGGNTTVELLSIENGYWRVSNTSTKILECYNTKACKGGVTGDPEYCLEGYEGPCEIRIKYFVRL